MSGLWQGYVSSGGEERLFFALFFEDLFALFFEEKGQKNFGFKKIRENLLLRFTCPSIILWEINSSRQGAELIFPHHLHKLVPNIIYANFLIRIFLCRLNTEGKTSANNLRPLNTERKTEKVEKSGNGTPPTNN
jgi:hypothetical protein